MPDALALLVALAIFVNITSSSFAGGSTFPMLAATNIAD
jgi:hypothetical protein